MKTQIVADGPERWTTTPEYAEQCREVTARVEERYRERLARAGWFSRLLLLLARRRELSRELEKLAPESACYLRDGLIAPSSRR